MTILQAYDKYDIPPNVVRHQLEVSAVGRYLCEHWIGDRVNLELVTQALLLHDMGNIIKFKRPFLGEIAANEEHWVKVQDQYFQKYGKDVHLATIAIIEDLRLPQVATLMNEMKSVWNDSEAQVSPDARICEYADCCVIPDGITSFDTRITDLETRYKMSEASLPIIAVRHNRELVEQHLDTSFIPIGKVDFTQEVEKLKLTSL